MTYVREMDDLRPEILAGGSGTISVWPKTDGLNTTASAAATYSIHDPSGSLLTSGTVSPTATALGARSVSRFVVTVTGLSDIDEDYQLRLTWVDATTSASNSEVVLFDVAAAPLGSLISLVDLLEVEPDVAETLDRLGVRLGYASGQTAREAAAAVYASLARQTLEARLASAAEASGQLRPSMLLDRRAVRRVERSWAMGHLYAALGGTAEGDDTASIRYRHWTAEGAGAFGSLRIKYSENEDLNPSGTTSALGSYKMRRVQG